MAANWLVRFGFKKNPYDTMALTASEEGAQLLVGRDEEVDNLMQQLTSSSMIPLLFGDNGVGKSSIANVAAYRLCQEYSEGDTRYFYLKIKSLMGTQLHNLKDFEESIYWDTLQLLLKNREFLLSRGVSGKEFSEMDKLARQKGSRTLGAGIGPVSASYEYVPNQLTVNNLPAIVQEWLEKCFGGDYSGGIVCVIDNLENSGTSNQVQETVERLRDTVFTLPGLRWILCGTTTVVSGVRTSRMLQGYLAEQEILPIAEDDVPLVVEKRIAYYGKANAKPPVDKTLFEMLYALVNKQLRLAFQLCQDFATFLNRYPMWINGDREKEFKAWLDQLAYSIPKKAFLIPKESWEVFDAITSFGADIPGETLEKYIIVKDMEEFHSLVAPLKEGRLLDIVPTGHGDDFVVRVTKDGWLANYKRHGFHLGVE